MKHIFLLALTGMSLCPASQAMAQDSIPALQPETAVSLPSAKGTVRLSREDCLRIALESNPVIRVADMEIERMDYSKKETVAALFPTLDFNLAYQRSIELQSIKMNMGGQSQTIKMGSDNSWNMGFSLALPVIAPALWKSIDLSETQILLTRESARTSRIDMVNAVNKAYYALLLARASKKVIQQNYDNARFNADLYEKKNRVGTASEYDVLRSAVQVKNVEPELLAADIAIKQAALQLKVLMGMDFNMTGPAPFPWPITPPCAPWRSTPSCWSRLSTSRNAPLFPQWPPPSTLHGPPYPTGICSRT